ncbi:gas vesicle accessory protein GvpU [Sutcliffiella horikoshii]|uniref:gas vesicle accessory protein GvpU n=1 Tax=Sutcliffiella horikoshii TaxID=79883 RepID=UPI001F48AAFF|nr:gas vesicle accessory protein GvpU [Sutcliffiella horikoshii]
MTNEQSAGKDNILAFLVRATNNHNLSIDITLNVNGAIVTGTIVSAKEYFVGLSETFEDGSDVAQQLSEKFAEAGEAIDSGEDAEASFIHLKDAKVFCGSSKPTPSKGTALWRGPLSDINGFFLDDFTDSGEEDEDSDDNSDYQSLKEKNGKLTDRIAKLEEMIAKLRDDDEDEDKSEESEVETESAENQDSEKDNAKDDHGDKSEESEVETESAENQDSEKDKAKDDENKEKSEKKRSGTKSSSTKTKKKSSSSKKTAKAE